MLLNTNQTLMAKIQIDKKKERIQQLENEIATLNFQKKQDVEGAYVYDAAIKEAERELSLLK